MERSSKNDNITNEASTEARSKFSCQMEDFMKFQRICQTGTTSTMEFLWLFVSIHTIVSYIVINEFPFSHTFREKILFFKEATSFTLFLSVFNYLMNIMMLGLLFGAKLKYRNCFWFSGIKKIISFYSFFARFLLFLSAFLILIDLEVNIAGMLITILVSLFDTLLIGNYSQRKQQNYQSSAKMSLVFKIGIISQLTSNSLLVRIQEPLILCALTVFSGGFWLVWHRKGGYGLFISKKIKLILRLFIGVQGGIGVACLSVLSPRLSLTTINSTQLILSIIIVSLYLLMFEKDKNRSFLSTKECIKNSSSLKEMDILFQTLAEDADYDKDIENTVNGILIHTIKEIQQDRCLSRFAQIYEPALKRTFSPFQTVKEKEPLARFYLKWLYQKAIENNPTKQLLLDFAEFGISSFGDLSSHCQALTLTETTDLNFLQRIRAFKLRLILQEQSEAFNRLILGGRIELDEVMTAEQIYQKVIKNIGSYCRGSISVWREMLVREVDSNVVRGKLFQNFKLIPQINQGFSSISKFFSAKPHWKMVYFNFALFLKNERIKNREILDLEQRSEDLDFTDEVTPLSTSLTSRQDLPDQIYFHEHSTIIMCTMTQGLLKFNRTSRNFEQITGYPPNEVIGSSLNMILPRQLKVSHDNMVNVWLESGRSTYQNTFYVRRTYIINKLSEDINSLVAFKLYVDLADPANILKFVSLINTSKKEDSLKKPQKSVQKTFKNLSRTNLLQRQPTITKNIISLDPQANIFLKEQNLKSASTSGQIETIKLVMRLLTAALIIFLISLGLDYQNSVEKIKKHSESLNTVINLFNMPMSIGRLYYNFLIIPPLYRYYMYPMITQQHEHFRKYSNSSLTQQIIFDSEINPPAEYGPDTVTTINQGITLSSTDVYYVVVSALTTLSHNPGKMSPHDFSILNSYLVPGYGTTLNHTKNNLHLSLKSSINTLKITQIICIVCLSLLLVAISFYICYKVWSYFAKMKDVMEIIVQFNNREIETVIEYWENVNQHFQRLTKGKTSAVEEQQLISLSDQSRMEEKIRQEHNKASLNQKHKDLVISDQEKKKRNRICVLMIILIIGFVPTIITIQLVNFVHLEKIHFFEQQGFYLVKYFPTTTIAGYALANQFYSSYYHFHPYNPEKFKETVSTIDLIVKQDYLKDIESDQLFFKKQQNYLFGNPCTFNPEVLISTNSSMSSCLESGNKTLSNGIVAYLRYIHPSLSQYLLNKSVVDVDQLKDISTGLKLVGYYFSDAIETWFQELIQKVQSFYNQNLILSLLISLVLLLLHFFIFEWIVLSNLRIDYKFMRNIFDSCVPDYILVKEKVIKHRFYSSGILQVN